MHVFCLKWLQRIDRLIRNSCVLDPVSLLLCTGCNHQTFFQKPLFDYSAKCKKKEERIMLLSAAFSIRLEIIGFEF